MRISKSTYRTAAYITSLICLGYFGYCLIGKWGDVMDSLRLFVSSGSLIVLEFVLMAAGVVIETLRWRFIRKVFIKKDTESDFVATLRAVALGNSTPANVGEHVGRGMSYEENRLATEASLYASVIQTIVIVFVGFLGGLYITYETGYFDMGLVKIISIVFLIITGVFFYWTKHSRLSSEIHQAVNSDGAAYNFTAAVIANIIKFCLFSFQYALLLSFGTDLSLFLYCHVLFYYVCITFIPRLNIIDVGVKGALSIHFFSSFNSEEIITSSALLLWGINIIIPTLAGYITILFRKDKFTSKP